VEVNDTISTTLNLSTLTTALSNIRARPKLADLSMQRLKPAVAHRRAAAWLVLLLSLAPTAAPCQTRAAQAGQPECRSTSIVPLLVAWLIFYAIAIIGTLTAPSAVTTIPSG